MIIYQISSTIRDHYKDHLDYTIKLTESQQNQKTREIFQEYRVMFFLLSLFVLVSLVEIVAVVGEPDTG